MWRPCALPVPPVDTPTAVLIRFRFAFAVNISVPKEAFADQEVIHFIDNTSSALYVW